MKLIIDENVNRRSLDLIELKRHYKNIEIIDGTGTIKKGLQDKKLARICKAGKYDLLTGDKRQYTSFLADKSDVVTIRKYKHSQKSKQTIYLVRWSSRQ